MIRYGKTAQNAVSAMSYLAEVHADGSRLSSQDIAQKRSISKPLVAKLLVVLSQAGLINGAPGPRGGYALARDPAQISLLEIVSLFERVDDRSMCPFGPDWCGSGDPCPMHDQLLAITDQMYQLLAGTKLDAFSSEDTMLKGDLAEL